MICYSAGSFIIVYKKLSGMPKWAAEISSLKWNWIMQNELDHSNSTLFNSPTLSSTPPPMSIQSTRNCFLSILIYVPLVHQPAISAPNMKHAPFPTHVWTNSAVFCFHLPINYSQHIYKTDSSTVCKKTNNKICPPPWKRRTLLGSQFNAGH